MASAYTEPTLSGYLQDRMKSFDTFGRPIQLCLDKKSTHKTWVGGILSILILVFAILLSQDVFTSLFGRTGVSTEQKLVFNQDPGFLPLNRNNLMFALGISDTAITPANQVFTYTISISNYTTLPNGTQIIINTAIPMKICTPADFPGLEDAFAQNSIQNYYCPNVPEYDIAGTFTSQTYMFIKLNASKCVNGTNPNTVCQTPDKITTYFNTHSKPRVALFFTNYMIDNDDHDHPLKPFIDQLYWAAQPFTLAKTADVYFREVNIITKDNPFSHSSGSTMSGFSYQGETVVDVFQNSGTEYLTAYLRKSHYVQNYVRNYKSVGDVLAILAGFWNVLHLVLGAFAIYYNDLTLKLMLANKLYQFEKPSTTHSKELRSANLPTNRFKNEYDKDADFVGLTKNKDTTRTTKLIQTIRNKRGNLIYGFNDLMKSFFFKLRESAVVKNGLLYKAMDKIAVDVDIVTMIQKLHDLEKLKAALLNDRQLTLFNLSPPPIIQREIPKSTVGNLWGRRKSQLSALPRDVYIKAFDDYKVMKNEENLVNQKVISLLDPELMRAFAEWSNEDDLLGVINKDNTSRSSLGSQGSGKTRGDQQAKDGSKRGGTPENTSEKFEVGMPVVI